MPFFILLGILGGLMSVYFCKMYWWIEGGFSKIDGVFKRLIIGGILLSVVIAFSVGAIVQWISRLIFSFQ